MEERNYTVLISVWPILLTLRFGFGFGFLLYYNGNAVAGDGKNDGCC